MLEYLGLGLKKRNEVSINTLLLSNNILQCNHVKEEPADIYRSTYTFKVLKR